jgi:hypothetical protein
VSRFLWVLVNLLRRHVSYLNQKCKYAGTSIFKVRNSTPFCAPVLNMMISLKTSEFLLDIVRVKCHKSTWCQRNLILTVQFDGRFLCYDQI